MRIKNLNDYPLLIHSLNHSINDNKLYILRDDLLPYSFGGNKVRKSIYFFDVIINGKYDTVVTYGSNSSNHVRVISNLAYECGVKCIVVNPNEENFESYNSDLIKKMSVEIVKCALNNISNTIEQIIENENNEGNKAYFIEGGGHGLLGTTAYYDVFNKILNYENNSKVNFDYIFLASGTGTTQAGLIVGNLINKSNKNIVGISIARSKEIGSKVIYKSIVEYLKQKKITISPELLLINFDDSYIVDGYATYNSEIEMVINNQFSVNGLPLDPTYTGKAFWGMEEYLKKNSINNKNILFIHTGGVPLFFDYISNKKDD